MQFVMEDCQTKDKRPQLGHFSSPSIIFHFLIHKMMMKINTQVNINLVLGYCFLSQ